MEWTRAAIDARVEKLAEEHEGEALVTAVAAFADQLDEGEREVLGTVLLEHARGREGVTGDYPKWSLLIPRFDLPKERKRRR